MKIAGDRSLGTAGVHRARGIADSRRTQEIIWTRYRSGRWLVARTQRLESRG